MYRTGNLPQNMVHTYIILSSNPRRLTAVLV